MAPTTASLGQRKIRLDRVQAACDLCKSRKVKCNGVRPCAYCHRRSHTCVFSGPRPRKIQRTSRSTPGRDTEDRMTDGSVSPNVSRSNAQVDHAEDRSGPAVPLEGRLLQDADGKFIFIGDCAPLSFLQTVRHLFASEITPQESVPQTSRDSVLEGAPQVSNSHGSQTPFPPIPFFERETLVTEFLIATSGLVDLFDNEQLHSDVRYRLDSSSDVAMMATCYLVLAIGAQEHDEKRADALFKHARETLMNKVFTSMTLASVQGFTLIALYMLRAFQSNGAYLYFSLAARTAYAIGLHRSEANASFGETETLLRARVWKSLRCVDMLISSLLGRPPSTSDVDCTIKYSVRGLETDLSVHVLDASVQMFMIIERVVVEVYSRKRISLRIAQYVSRQHKDWASRWLGPLTAAMIDETIPRNVRIGACQDVCSYYYGIMLLSRPFLIYELYEFLGAGVPRPSETSGDHEQRKKFADAAVDAAMALLSTIEPLIHSGTMPTRMPMIVSWLFTSCLCLTVAVLGRGGLDLHTSSQESIYCLDYFARVDPNARRYSQIVQGLLGSALKHVNKRESQLRRKQKQASSQLFGLLLDEPHREGPGINSTNPPSLSVTPSQAPVTSSAAPDWTMYDGDFFALPWMNESDAGLQDFLQPNRQGLNGSSADVPLFPLDDYLAIYMDPLTAANDS